MDIDFKAPVDLVAITSWTMNSFRAYEIADQYREQGVPVIMGGPTPTFIQTRRLSIAMRWALEKGRRFGR
jgi:hypothetical protein